MIQRCSSERLNACQSVVPWARVRPTREEMCDPEVRKLWALEERVKGP